MDDPRYDETPEGYDAEDAAVYGPFEPAFRAITGPTPRCGPGDLRAAASFLYKVQEARARGGWTAGERSSLAYLERVWARRASGRDTRFQLVGSRPGPAPRPFRRVIAVSSRQWRDRWKEDR